MFYTMIPQPLQLFLEFYFLCFYYALSEPFILHWQQLPVLLCWPTILEVNGGGMAVKAELSHQYSIAFCWCATDGSSLTKWHLTSKCAGSKGISLNSSMMKSSHPQTFTDTCWICMETKQWCEHSGAVGGSTFQQWWQNPHSADPILVLSFQAVSMVNSKGYYSTKTA